MERKLNCWEYRNCGREKGGLMVSVLGECPASTSMAFDGINGGMAGGRACWMVRESNRLARIQTCNGASCNSCEFYRRVVHEERSGAKHQFSTTIA
jgi:hypothetical protein